MKKIYSAQNQTSGRLGLQKAFYGNINRVLYYFILI